MKKSVVLLLTFACIICLAACNVSTEHGKSVENVTAAPSGVITTDTPSPLTTEALTSCPTLNFFDKMGLKAEVSERIMESKGEDNEYCYHIEQYYAPITLVTQWGKKTNRDNKEYDVIDDITINPMVSIYTYEKDSDDKRGLINQVLYMASGSELSQNEWLIQQDEAYLDKLYTEYSYVRVNHDLCPVFTNKDLENGKFEYISVSQEAGIFDKYTGTAMCIEGYVNGEWDALQRFNVLYEGQDYETLLYFSANASWYEDEGEYKYGGFTSLELLTPYGYDGVVYYIGRGLVGNGNGELCFNEAEFSAIVTGCGE